MNHFLKKNKTKFKKSDKKMYNIDTNIQKNVNQINYLQQIEDLNTELKDYKEKNKIITNKFQQTKKERDDLKKENKELMEQVAHMQN